MTHRSRQRGFSTIELLVVIGLIAILSVISLLNLTRVRPQKELQGTVQSVASVLREARSRSIAQSSSTLWGVYFENSTSTAPFYALFSTAYSASTTLQYQRLPATVVYATSSIASGGSLTVTFAQRTGSASVSTSIMFALAQGTQTSSTLWVASSGIVTY